jgi:hypothetical protein
MRRITSAAFLVAAVAAAALAVAVSAGAESGPNCADITNGNWNYATRGTINVGLVLAGAQDALSSTPCKSVTYTLVISAINEPPKVVTQKGNHLFTGVTFSDTDDNVCISATTGSSGGKVHDAAPNAGCFEVTVGTSGGGAGGFN